MPAKPRVKPLLTPGIWNGVLRQASPHRGGKVSIIPHRKSKVICILQSCRHLEVSLETKGNQKKITFAERALTRTRIFGFMVSVWLPMCFTEPMSAGCSYTPGVCSKAHRGSHSRRADRNDLSWNMGYNLSLTVGDTIWFYRRQLKQVHQCCSLVQETFISGHCNWTST